MYCVLIKSTYQPPPRRRRKTGINHAHPGSEMLARIAIARISPKLKTRSL